MSVTIYGASDDLIEIEGDICEEFGAYNCWRWLHFDDGTVVKIGYDLVPDKGWHIEVVKPGTAKAVPHEPVFEDGDHYTDRLELAGKIKSVECWRMAEGPSRDDVLNWWVNEFDTRDYSVEHLAAARRLLLGKE